MSPSEEQLRAALRAGEPDGAGGLSAERLIARAYDARHRRLVRSGSVLGGVAAAAAAGVLIVSLGTSTQSHSASSSGEAASTRAGQLNGTAAVAGKGDGAAAGSAAASCPATFSVGSKGTEHGSFFAGPVASIMLCLYPEGGGAALRANNGQVLTSTLTGTAAQQVAASLDAAAKQPLAEPCPLFRLAAAKVLVMIPVGTDGRAMAPIATVVLDNPCNQPVSNGAVVRYNWTAPSVLTPYLHQGAAISAPPRPQPQPSSPLEHGSPIRT